MAALAGLLLGERVSPRQWAGLVLGLMGVALVLAQKLGRGLGEALGPAALLGMALTLAGVTLARRSN